MTSMPPLTILVLEDLPAVRSGLVAMVLRAFPHCAVHEASTIEQGKQIAAEQRIDIALIDLGLPDGSGLEVLRAIRQHSQSACCVVSTIYDDDAHLFEALAAGADGYLLKERPESEIALALQLAYQGVPALSPSIARRVLQSFRQERAAPSAAGSPTAVAAESLTPRERAVLTAVGQGKRVIEVATELGITPNTVAGYVKDIYRKLHISSRAQAALEARRRGLV
jgi:DNA-binding NarL/FixJ family response regulator